MQTTVNNGTSTILSDVNEFYQSIGDQLDACHPEAFDVIYDIVNREPNEAEIKELLSDFQFENSDELDACNEEAYNLLLKIVNIHSVR